MEILTSVNWHLATTMATFWWVVCVAMATLVAYKNSSQIVCLMFCNYRTAGNFEGENFREFQGFVPIHKSFLKEIGGVVSFGDTSKQSKKVFSVKFAEVSL